MANKYVTLYSLEGLEDAVVGTAWTASGDEVLAYDYDKSLEIMLSHGFDHEQITTYIESIANKLDSSKQPVFVHLDPNLGKLSEYQEDFTLH